MGGKVELMISNAMQSLVSRDTEMAERIIAYDHEIDRLEMLIDEMCLEVLARRQPTARDLRFIALSLKIVTDLERIGDQCSNIAKMVKELNLEPPFIPCIDLPRMAEATSTMVKEALDAFMRGDVELAIKVCSNDQFVDELYRQIQQELVGLMTETPATISRSIKINYVAKYLERIADHSTNIAEMVIFMVEGKDIRHATAIDPPSARQVA